MTIHQSQVDREWVILGRALHRFLFQGAFDKEWQETEHPRRNDGEFRELGGGGTTSPTQLSSRDDHAGVSGGMHHHNKAALKHYTGLGFKRVNGYLVGNAPADEQTKQTIAHLDDLMARAKLPEPMNVYRGASSLAVKDILQQAGGQLRKGQILTMKGFLSSSSDDFVAKRFSEQSAISIFMEMRLPKGAKAVDIAKYSDVGEHEKEILIDRNSSFKVLSFDGKKRKLVLEMTMAKKPKDSTKIAGDEIQKGTEVQDEDRFGWGGPGGISVSGKTDGPVVLSPKDLERAK